MRHPLKKCEFCQGKFAPTSRRQRFCQPKCATDSRAQELAPDAAIRMKPEARRRVREIEARQRARGVESFSQQQARREQLLQGLSNPVNRQGGEPGRIG